MSILSPVATQQMPLQRLNQRLLNHILETGGLKAFWDPYGDTASKAAWADRMMHAHLNAVENLVIFAPLVLLIEITHLNSPLTATATMAYFFARLVHFWVFTFAIPYLRVVTFLTGVAMQMILLGSLFQYFVGENFFASGS